MPMHYLSGSGKEAFHEVEQGVLSPHIIELTGQDTPSTEYVMDRVKKSYALLFTRNGIICFRFAFHYGKGATEPRTIEPILSIG